MRLAERFPRVSYVQGGTITKWVTRLHSVQSRYLLVDLFRRSLAVRESDHAGMAHPHLHLVFPPISQTPALETPRFLNAVTLCFFTASRLAMSPERIAWSESLRPCNRVRNKIHQTVSTANRVPIQTTIDPFAQPVTVGIARSVRLWSHSKTQFQPNITRIAIYDRPM